LKVAKDADYNETLTWEEDFYPALEPGKDAWEQIQALMPFKRKRRVFSTKTNTISTISTLNND